MRRRIARRSWVAASAVLLAWGCESSTVFPTDPSGPAPFASVLIDRSSVLPGPGVMISAGDSVWVEAEAYFETAKPTDLIVFGFFTAGPIPSEIEEDPFGVLPPSRDGTDVVLHEVWAELGGSPGARSLSEWFRIPTVSAACGDFDRIGIVAWVLDVAAILEGEDFAPGGGLNPVDLINRSEKTAGARFARDEIVLGSIEGGNPPSGPCVWGEWLSLFSTPPTREVRWGQAIQHRMVRVPAGSDPRLVSVSDGSELRRLYRGTEPERPSLEVLEWLVTPGTEDGAVEVRVDGQVVPVGGGVGLRPLAVVSDDLGGGFEDWFEVNFTGLDNNSFAHPTLLLELDDLILHVEGGVIVPEDYVARLQALTIGTSDQVVAPDSNLIGSGEHGSGDWYLFEASVASDLCVAVDVDDPNRLDLFLWEARRVEGTRWNFLYTVMGMIDSVVGGSGPKQISTTQTAELYLLWVAPHTIAGEYAEYSLSVASCAVLN